MKDTEISSPEQLDAALVSHRMSRRENLWKTAAGQTYRVTDIVMIIIGFLSLIYGGYGFVFEDDLGAITLVVMGGGLVAAGILRHQQSQIQALRRLLEEANLRDF